MSRGDAMKRRKWAVGSFDLFTVHCSLPTTHCPLFSEEV